MVGGPESTTGLTCGRRETVEKCGEQLQEPRRRCERRESRRERERGEGEREDGKKRKQHVAHCVAPIPAATAAAARSRCM